MKCGYFIWVLGNTSEVQSYMEHRQKMLKMYTVSKSGCLCDPGKHYFIQKLRTSSTLSEKLSSSFFNKGSSNKVLSLLKGRSKYLKFDFLPYFPGS